MVINHAGNVGIGTTSPTAAKLVVDSDTAPQILVKNSGGGNAQILFEDNSGGTQNANITFDQSGDNTLSIATEYDSPNDLNKIKLVPGGEVAMTLSGGDDSTGTNGIITFNGYVGTRQTGTPTYILGTDNSGNVVKVLGGDIPGVPAGSGTLNTVAMWTPDGDTLGDSPITISGNNATFAGNVQATAYKIAGSTILQGTSTVTVGSGGGTGKVQLNTTSGVGLILDGNNVGIGTTSPSTKLEVTGHVTINSPAGASQTSYGLRLRKTNSSSAVQAGGEILASAYPINTNAANLIFKTANTSANLTQRMVIDGIGNVGIGTTSPKAKFDVNGHFCVDSKSHAVTNAFTTCLTVNLNSHTGCYVTLTCFGDWGSHSSAAYRGEFFLQNGANGYAEPGIILRQDDNTSNGTDQIVCQILDPTGSGNPKDFEIQIRTTATTGTTSFTGQLTYTVQGKFNSIT
jgi:hypothetical protein